MVTTLGGTGRLLALSTRFTARRPSFGLVRTRSLCSTSTVQVAEAACIRWRHSAGKRQRLSRPLCRHHRRKIVASDGAGNKKSLGSRLGRRCSAVSATRLLGSTAAKAQVRCRHARWVAQPPSSHLRCWRASKHATRRGTAVISRWRAGSLAPPARCVHVGAALGTTPRDASPAADESFYRQQPKSWCSCGVTLRVWCSHCG